MRLKRGGLHNYIDDSKVFSEPEYLTKAFCLLSLYSDQEYIPNKHNFINPLAMNSWKGGHNHPTESLKKWVTSRLKNNIRGGATQWRKILNTGTGIDSSNEGGALTFKLSYNYIDLIEGYIDHKLNLSALAIWYHRFVRFDKQVSQMYLEKNFCQAFNLTIDEQNKLFCRKNYVVEFSQNLYQTEAIRRLISDAPTEEASIQLTEVKDASSIELNLTKKIMCFPKVSELPVMNIEIIYSVLNDYKQVILAGPPGTSKSYWAKQIAKEKFHNKYTQVQFHPQFSYQQFVGGYIIEGESVVYQRGILLDLLDSIGDEKHLLIIDEINRANITQVFGEIFQLLDRSNTLKIQSENGEKKEYCLPGNLYILATLNTTDRSLARLDYAFKRRFAEIYIPVNELLLDEYCDQTDFIVLSDFLQKINKNLLDITKDKDIAIGHAIFLSEHVYDEEKEKYQWDFTSFRDLFNYKILPMIADYCGNDLPTIQQVIGKDLSISLSDTLSFKKALLNFMELDQE